MPGGLVQTMEHMGTAVCLQVGVGAEERMEQRWHTGSDSQNAVSCPHAGGHGKCRRSSIPVRATPNAGTAPDRLQPPLVPRCGFRRQVSASVR